MKGPFPYPKIFGFVAYTDWVNKAHREFDRFNASADPVDRIDHIFNFCASIANAMEYAFYHNVKGKPGWSGFADLNNFRQWLIGRCVDVGKVETVNMAAKHTEFTRHWPQVDGGSASTSGSFLYADPVKGASHNFSTDGVLLGDARKVVVGDMIQHEVPYSVENLYKDGVKTRFFHAAKRSLTLWDQFDPSKGEGQTFIL